MGKQKHKKQKRTKKSRQSSERGSSQQQSQRSRKHKKQRKHRERDQKRNNERRYGYNDRNREREDRESREPKEDNIRKANKQETKVKKENVNQIYGNNQGWGSQSENKEHVQAFQQAIKQQSMQQNAEEQKKQQPNWEPSGILLQYYNAREGIALKFHEPPQSQVPTAEWRIYPFKDNSAMNPIILKNSCYLIGKDQRVCDILCQNSSISRQHAVIQFRAQHLLQIDGSYSVVVKPYVMDLQSTNGTLLNGQKIDSSRYYELLDKDVLRFGLSQRDYVMFKVPELLEEI